MARTDNLTNYLKDVADAIREKRQITNEISANEFDTEIRAISTGGSGDVKLFETQEEMQSDENPKEGDLAVVYRQEIQNFQEDTITQFMTFPETVTLDEAYTGNAYGMLRSVDSSSGYFDGNVQLSQTSFRFSGYGMSDMVRVEYTSTDGITYTRTSMSPETNPIDFGVEVKWEQYEPFIPQFGKFMLIEGNTFEGLFEYVLNTKNKDAILMRSNTTWEYLNPNEPSFTEEYVNIVNAFLALNKLNLSEGSNIILTYDGTNFILYTNFTSYNEVYVSALRTGVTGAITSNIVAFVNTGSTTEGKVYKLNDTVFDEIAYTLSDSELGTNYKNVILTDYSSFSNDTQFTSLSVRNGTYVNYSSNYFHVGDPTLSGGQQGSVSVLSPEPSYGTINKYIYASTQLSLFEASQLLPGIIGYGKNGVVTGDGTIYNSLDSTNLYNRLYPDDEMYLGLIIDEITKADIATISKRKKPIKAMSTKEGLTEMLRKQINEHFGLSSTGTVTRLFASNETSIGIFASVFENSKTYGTILLYDYTTDTYRLFYTTFDFGISYTSMLGTRLIDNNLYVRLAQGTTYNYVKVYKFNLSTTETDITSEIVNDTFTNREPFMNQTSNNLIVTFDNNAIDCITGKMYSNTKSSSGTSYGTIILYDDMSGHVVITEYDRDNRIVYLRYLTKTNSSATTLGSLTMSKSATYDGTANMYLLKLSDSRYMVLFKYDTVIQKAIIQDGQLESTESYTGTKITTFEYVKLIDENTIVLKDKKVVLNADNTYTLTDVEEISGISGASFIDVQKNYGINNAQNSPILTYLLDDAISVLVTPIELVKPLQFGLKLNSSGPMTQAEYDEALTTANEIKGGN